MSQIKVRVLFVCMGNICRSPAAEIVFRHLVHLKGLEDEIEIDSAGTIGFHRGSPPDSRMSATLKKRGYIISGASRMVTAHDLEHFDLILAADHENLADLRRLDSSGLHAEKIRLLVDYCRRPHPGHVPDPYYGGAKGFEEVADLVEDACAGLIEEILEKAQDSVNK